MMSAPDLTRLAPVKLGYLFSDVEDSTARWERTPEHMRSAMARYRAIVTAFAAAHGGVIHDYAGDGVFVIFKGGEALQCALDIQLAMQREDWSAVGGLELRLGVHQARPMDDDSVDQVSANRAARITSSGWGGQIVVSKDAADAYGLPVGARFVDLGLYHFKGVEAPLGVGSLVHPQLAKQEFPPFRTDPLEGFGLPQPAGPLIGRERDLSDIKDRLFQTRLLSIVAPGGAGKTRLALQVAADCAANRPVVFASLDGVANGGEFVSAIASALRFPFHGNENPETQLINYLRNRATMLVLDKGDAMAGQAGFASLLAAACPRVTILATSREPLHASGEVVYRLRGLSFGGADLAQSPAFQLFAFEARAQGVDRDLTGELDAFRDICALVDGSPLALRLVARWSRLLSLSEIAAEMHNGPEFLTDASQTDPHLTLRGLFEGSWRLLAPEQQKGLSRLSVFKGKFDFEAARTVAGIDHATYAALADKSLLDAVGGRKFSIHPLIRSYARGKLALRGEDEAQTLARHARYYLAAICALTEKPASIASREGFAALQEVYPDLKAAWRHANTSRIPEVAAAAAPLHFFLNLRSMIREGIELFSVADCDRDLRPLFDGLLAATLFQHGELDKALALARKVYAARGGIVPRAFAREVAGAVAHTRGDYRQAKRHYERGFKLWTQCENELNGSFTATNLALMHALNGEHAEARRWGKRAFRMSRRSGNLVGVRLIHMLTGDQALRDGRLEDARANYQKALQTEGAGEAPHVRSLALRRLGALCLAAGDPKGALGYHMDALTLARDTGEQRMQAFANVAIGEDYRLLGSLDAATSHLVGGVRRAAALQLDPLLNEGLIGLALVLNARGAKTNARRLTGLLARRALGELSNNYTALCDALGDPAPMPLSMQNLDEILEDVVDEAEIGVSGDPLSV